VGIEHPKTAEEDEDLPDAKRDLHGPRIPRYVRHLLVAFFAMVTIVFHSGHDDLLLKKV
jgi:hypothetical protein